MLSDLNILQEKIPANQYMTCRYWTVMLLNI